MGEHPLVTLDERLVSGRGPDRQPVGARPQRRRLVVRVGRSSRGRPRAACSRHRDGRVDHLPELAQRLRRPQADRRPAADRGRRADQRQPGRAGADGAHRARRRAPARRAHGHDAIRRRSAERSSLAETSSSASRKPGSAATPGTDALLPPTLETLARHGAKRSVATVPSPEDDRRPTSSSSSSPSSRPTSTPTSRRGPGDGPASLADVVAFNRRARRRRARPLRPGALRAGARARADVRRRRTARRAPAISMRRSTMPRAGVHGRRRSPTSSSHPRTRPPGRATSSTGDYFDRAVGSRAPHRRSRAGPSCASRWVSSAGCRSGLVLIGRPRSRGDAARDRPCPRERSRSPLDQRRADLEGDAEVDASP